MLARISRAILTAVRRTISLLRLHYPADFLPCVAAWDKWGPLESTTEHEWGEDGLSGATSATSALGAMLSAGNHHGPGVHGAVPSKSSRYFSVDFGLTHLVGLSLNGYNGVDLCTTKCNEEQKEWLKKDLAAVDRSKTPWCASEFLNTVGLKRLKQSCMPG